MKFREPQPIPIVLDTMYAWMCGDPVWPYAKIIETWGSSFEMYRLAWRRNDFSDDALHHFMDRHYTRDLWINRYGFSIPCAELMDELATSKIVLEIGAGSGYMTRLMRNRHINVVGTDSGHGGYKFAVAAHDPGQIRLPGKTAIRRFHHADTVFCSWPSLNETWFRQALKAMHIGQRMIVVREDACGTDDAWEYFDACFEEVNTINIPAFQHLNDYVDVRVKKRQKDRG